MGFLVTLRNFLVWAEGAAADVDGFQVGVVGPHPGGGDMWHPGVDRLWLSGQTSFGLQVIKHRGERAPITFLLRVGDQHRQDPARDQLEQRARGRGQLLLRIRPGRADVFRVISSTSAPRRLTDLWSWLPRGQHLSDGVWRGRHRFLQVLLWLHVPFLSAMGIANGEEVWHTMSEVGLVATLALFSHLLEGRAVRASVVAAGLLSCSAILVHFTGGLIESHFHFFAVLLLISFYQDWRPFVMGVLWVVVHHGVVGSLYPTQVYNHPAALARPVLWAVIHALYVLGLVIALVVYWWFMEVAQREVAAAQVQQRLAEEKSERLQEERARQAEIGRMKDQFIASVSHELRTPLTAVVGFAELLRHEGWDLDEEDRRSMVDSLAREALDVASLVEDLLVAARSAAGELSVHRVPVSLREQAAQVLEGLEGLGTGHIQLVAPPGEEVVLCRPRPCPSDPEEPGHQCSALWRRPSAYHHRERRGHLSGLGMGQRSRCARERTRT